jgi:hypothetical protein
MGTNRFEQNHVSHRDMGNRSSCDRLMMWMRKTVGFQVSMWVGFSSDSITNISWTIPTQRDDHWLYKIREVSGSCEHPVPLDWVAKSLSCWDQVRNKPYVPFCKIAFPNVLSTCWWCVDRKWSESGMCMYCVFVSWQNFNRWKLKNPSVRSSCFPISMQSNIICRQFWVTKFLM